MKRMMMKTANKVWFGAALVLVMVAVAAAQVPGFFSICNAIVGYQVNSAAPVNHVLCGNGSVYGDCAAAPTATALAATPTQCSGGTPLASGIQANGNANCSPVSSRNLTPVDKTSSRFMTTIYPNTYGSSYQVCVTANDLASASTYGSGFGFIIQYGPTSASVSGGAPPFINETSVHNDKGQATQCSVIPTGWFYNVVADTVSVTNPQPFVVTNWSEAPLQ